MDQLDGYLEDLSIRDILQILSLSKKSGTLRLESEGHAGQVIFQAGQIIRASSSQTPLELGQMMIAAELISREQLEKALLYQQQGRHRPLGDLLSELYKVPAATIEEIVAQQIEKIVISFFSWRKGRFHFKLEETQSFGSAQLSPLDIILETGLSPQRLALKGQRFMEHSSVDEDSLELELAEINKRQAQQGHHLLRGMLAELKHPEMGGGIILLILRYASEIMQRAVVFDVRGAKLVGLGQFGVDEYNNRADEIVRKMRLQVEPGSLFAQVMAEKKALRGALGQSRAELLLTDFLGRPKEQVFLAPLLSDGKVVALLYGELSAEDDDSQRLQAFEVFLSQAGLAMEQALSGN